MYRHDQYTQSAGENAALDLMLAHLTHDAEAITSATADSTICPTTQAYARQQLCGLLHDAVLAAPISLCTGRPSSDPAASSRAWSRPASGTGFRLSAAWSSCIPVWWLTPVQCERYRAFCVRLDP